MKVEVEHNNAWGKTPHKQSTGTFTALVVNSLFAAFFFVVSIMHSFLQMPMFGDEMESSPEAIIITTLIWTIALDVIAFWRGYKLFKLWSLTSWNKFFLWAYQFAFIGVACYSNFWMILVVWFWWNRF